jgi:hypothetical protein
MVRAATPASVAVASRRQRLVSRFNEMRAEKIIASA